MLNDQPQLFRSVADPDLHTIHPRSIWPLDLDPPFLTNKRSGSTKSQNFHSVPVPGCLPVLSIFIKNLFLAKFWYFRRHFINSYVILMLLFWVKFCYPSEIYFLFFYFLRNIFYGIVLSSSSQVRKIGSVHPAHNCDCNRPSKPYTVLIWNQAQVLYLNDVYWLLDGCCLQDLNTWNTFQYHSIAH